MKRALAVALAILLVGCAGKRELMPAPNLYQGSSAPELFGDLPEELKSSQVDLMYVTDRGPERDESGQLAYGFERSRSAAFGSAIVSIEPEMTWEELEAVSLQPERSTKLTLELGPVRELGRFPETPPAIVSIDGEVQLDPQARAKAQLAEVEFRNEIFRRLELAAKPEVLIFIHGYNNSFEDAAEVLAELWHFMGREHVPLLYTWPAGHGGVSGYIYDRESGEFTIHHLKNVLRSLIKIEEIERFHLIAHSRGTDVLSTAIRELTLEIRIEQGELHPAMTKSTLVLAAPDLDVAVVEQRLIAEQIGRGLDETIIYTSPEDNAISLAETFFKSVKRLGRMSVQDMSDTDLSSIENLQGIAIIDFPEKSGKTGHDYFHSSPAASSDLILTIRYDRNPGEENGRPLTPTAPGFWRIDAGYPNQRD